MDTPCCLCIARYNTVQYGLGTLGQDNFTNGTGLTDIGRPPGRLFYAQYYHALMGFLKGLSHSANCQAGSEDERTPSQENGPTRSFRVSRDPPPPDISELGWLLGSK